MEPIYITSRNNPLVISLAGLSDKKERDRTGLYIVEGFKSCEQACGLGQVEYVLLREDRTGDSAYADLVSRCGGKLVVLSTAAYQKITQDRTPDGILFVLRAESAKLPADMTGERICILDGIQDPGNVGTILRSAAALGVDRVILHDCADVHHPKVLRATMGAYFKISISLCTDLLELIVQLRKAGRRVIAAALSSGGLILGRDPLYPTDCLIFGNEGHGIADTIIRVCDTTVKIPMTDKAESLNAAAAAAVLLWEQSTLEKE